MLKRFVHWVHGQPQLVRVMIAAAVGTVLAWLAYEVIYFLNPLEPRATLIWVFAFFLGIFRQHLLHRTLSFPETHTTYETSLRREALVSTCIIVASAGLNLWLTKVAMIHHRLASGVYLTSVAALEFVLMKLYVFSSQCTGGGTRQ